MIAKLGSIPVFKSIFQNYIMEKIAWKGWIPEAFQQAKHEHKPVLLSISASWCHWCHRLDHDTLENPPVVEFVNEHFVPVRVDTDKQPDINARYNAGGWPTVAVLDSNGFPIQSGTYFAPEPFLQWLAQGLTAFLELKHKSSLVLGQPNAEKTDFSAFLL